MSVCSSSLCCLVGAVDSVLCVTVHQGQSPRHEDHGQGLGWGWIAFQQQGALREGAAPRESVAGMALTHTVILATGHYPVCPEGMQPLLLFR